MSATEELPRTDAHAETVNVPPQRAGDNLFSGDRALAEGVAREAGPMWLEDCEHAGAVFASPQVIELGFAANEHPPRHVPYDRSGARTDEVEFHPAWHRVMSLAVELGLHGAPWADARPGAHVARAAKFMLLCQVEAGSTCPIAMTWSCVPALRLDPELARAWEGLVTGRDYDPRPLPRGEKRGALIGMALTEKVGGSDVRGTLTVAERGGDGDYRVAGSKWFVSATQSDAFFVLAQAPGGLSCLLVPRRLEDGTDNGVRFERLKDKLGNRSNATAEVRLCGAQGRLVGEEGAGVRAIMEMIAGTRQDCVLASTAVMRLGTAEAIHHASHRGAFGRRLIDQPLMRNVLADLALETEATTAGALRLSRAMEQAAGGDERAALLRRLISPALKYWTCKRAPIHAAEALECQGGLGFVEESRLPRNYREAPLMSIWEGSGNVQCLDVLRACRRSPDAIDALLEELELAGGGDVRLDLAFRALGHELRDGGVDEAQARRLSARIALCLQGALLVRHAPAAVADAFCATRLGEGAGAGAVFGQLPSRCALSEIIERHRPDAPGSAV